ncbi:hypothetical protein ES708_18741 [subsurface metagenome]
MGGLGRLCANGLGCWPTAILERESDRFFAPPPPLLGVWIASYCRNSCRGDNKGLMAEEILAGTLCAIPATVVYWCLTS